MQHCICICICSFAHKSFRIYIKYNNYLFSSDFLRLRCIDNLRSYHLGRLCSTLSWPHNSQSLNDAAWERKLFCYRLLSWYRTCYLGLPFSLGFFFTWGASFQPSHREPFDLPSRKHIESVVFIIEGPDRGWIIRDNKCVYSISFDRLVS